MSARFGVDDRPRQSFGELIGELTDGSAQLVRDEIRLARAEMAESMLSLRHGVVVLAVGIALGLFGVAAALTGVVLLLSRYLLDGRTWLAALLVGGVLLIVAAVLSRRGAAAVSATRLAPHETAISLKETAGWLKHPTRSDGR